MKNYLAGWKNITDVYIPPVNPQYRQENIVIRKKIPPRERYVDDTSRTVFLDKDSDEKTILLVAEPSSYGRLVRLRTQETFRLVHEKGIIGKSNDADYRIVGNPAVSREHAEIYTENEKVYLKDLNSSNHSWVNEKLVEGSVELPDQAVIKLADEEFQYFTR